jgi:hypothetical protein
MVKRAQNNNRLIGKSIYFIHGKEAKLINQTIRKAIFKEHLRLSNGISPSKIGCFLVELQAK